MQATSGGSTGIHIIFQRTKNRLRKNNDSVGGGRKNLLVKSAVIVLLHVNYITAGRIFWLLRLV